MSGGEQSREIILPVTEVARHPVSLALAGKDNGIVNICSGIQFLFAKLSKDG